MAYEDKHIKELTVLSGKAVAADLKEELANRIKRTYELYKSETRVVRPPKLVIMMVGNNPASEVYVRNKLKAASDVEMITELRRFDEAITEAALLAEIDKLNADDSVDGVLVQLPLPRHIDVTEVQAAIAVDKDVDGFAKEHMGACWLGTDCYIPCTAAGIMRILKYYEIELSGLNCLIIGRSNIVAKPLAALMLAADATVTIAHSKTRNLKNLAQTMDLIVVSVGKADFLQADMIKPGAILIDVGINRRDDGKLTGDIATEAYEKASAYTPVPGGVGLLTVAELLNNTVKAWLYHLKQEQ